MTIVGKSIGADDTPQALAAGKIAGRIALVSSMVIALVLALFRDFWLTVFTSDPEVIRLGANVLIVFAIIQIPKAVNIVFTGNLRGSADLAWLMWLAMLSVMIFEVFGAYTLAFIFNFSLAGLWLVQGVDEAFRLTANYWRFRQSRWKVKNIFQ